MIRYIRLHVKYGCLQLSLFVLLFLFSLCSDVGYKLRLIGKWFVYCFEHRALYTFTFYDYNTVKTNDIRPDGLSFEAYKQMKKENGDLHFLDEFFEEGLNDFITPVFVVDDETAYKVGKTYKVPHCWIVDTHLESSIVVIHNELYQLLLKKDKQAWLVFMHEFGHIETHNDTKKYGYSIKEAVADAFSFTVMKATFFDMFVYYARLHNTRDVVARMFCGTYSYLITQLER